jgi:hypothetical protein
MRSSKFDNDRVLCSRTASCFSGWCSPSVLSRFLGWSGHFHFPCWEAFMLGTVSSHQERGSGREESTRQVRGGKRGEDPFKQTLLPLDLIFANFSAVPLDFLLQAYQPAVASAKHTSEQRPLSHACCDTRTRRFHSRNSGLVFL